MKKMLTDEELAKEKRLFNVWVEKTVVVESLDEGARDFAWLAWLAAKDAQAEALAAADALAEAAVAMAEVVDEHTGRGSAMAAIQPALSTTSRKGGSDPLAAFTSRRPCGPAIGRPALQPTEAWFAAVCAAGQVSSSTHRLGPVGYIVALCGVCEARLGGGMGEQPLPPRVGADSKRTNLRSDSRNTVEVGRPARVGHGDICGCRQCAPQA